MARKNHFPANPNHFGRGAVLLDHFGTPFIVIELNPDENVFVDLRNGKLAGSANVACPWAVVDRTEVQMPAYWED